MLLLDVGYRWVLVRAVQLVGLAFAGVMILLAYLAAFLATDSGGTLLPLWERLIFAAMALAAGLAAAVGTALYGMRYVTRLERHDADLSISTLGPIGTRRITVPVADAEVGLRFEGRFHGAPRVHAPGRFLRLRGYRFRFLLDMQAPVIDETGLMRLFRRVDDGPVAEAPA